MASYDLESDEEEWLDLDAVPDPQLPAFTLGLSITGDGGSYRFQNDPSAPYQRETYVERKGATDIRCSCVDVVHGLFSPDGKAFATLIILDFRFDARKRARRIKSADIALRFGAMKKDAPEPEVFRISPLGTMHLKPTTHVEATTHSGNVTLGGGTVVTASGTMGWERSVTKDKEDQTSITGSIDLVGRNHGKKNRASWTLMENASTEQGVPTYLRTAILLKRTNEEPFQCHVEIKAEMDFKSTIERVFGKQPIDDPVLFDPELPPTNNLQEYDVENLGAFDVDGAFDLTFSTILTNVVKEKTLKQN